MWIKKSTLLTYNGTAIDTPELDYHYLAPKQGKWSVHQRTVNTCAQENTVIPLSATLRVQDALTQPNLHNYCKLVWFEIEFYSIILHHCHSRIFI